jgi:hypothetical protein
LIQTHENTVHRVIKKKNDKSKVFETLDEAIKTIKMAMARQKIDDSLSTMIENFFHNPILASFINRIKAIFLLGVGIVFNFLETYGTNISSLRYLS